MSGLTTQAEDQVVQKRAANESLLLCLIHQGLSANHQPKLHSIFYECCKYQMIVILPQETCTKTDFS